MPTVTLGNTTVTEAIPAGGSFTPSTGVEIRANLQASDTAGGTIEKGGTTAQIANGATQTVTSEVRVFLDDSTTVSAQGADVYLSGVVIDS